LTPLGNKCWYRFRIASVWWPVPTDQPDRDPRRLAIPVNALGQADGLGRNLGSPAIRLAVGSREAQGDRCVEAPPAMILAEFEHHSSRGLQVLFGVDGTRVGI